MVTLYRELTFDHGKSVGHKVTLLWKVINGSGTVYKEALHGYDHDGRTLTLRMHPNGMKYKYYEILASGKHLLYTFSNSSTEVKMAEKNPPKVEMKSYSCLLNDPSNRLSLSQKGINRSSSSNIPQLTQNQSDDDVQLRKKPVKEKVG